jgi:hypothetical protein
MKKNSKIGPKLKITFFYEKNYWGKHLMGFWGKFFFMKTFKKNTYIWYIIGFLYRSYVYHFYIGFVYVLYWIYEGQFCLCSIAFGYILLNKSSACMPWRFDKSLWKVILLVGLDLICAPSSPRDRSAPVLSVPGTLWGCNHPSRQGMCSHSAPCTCMFSSVRKSPSQAMGV